MTFSFYGFPNYQLIAGGKGSDLAVAISLPAFLVGFTRRPRSTRLMSSASGNPGLQILKALKKKPTASELSAEE